VRPRETRSQPTDFASSLKNSKNVANFEGPRETTGDQVPGYRFEIWFRNHVNVGDHKRPLGTTEDQSRATDLAVGFSHT